MCSPPPVAKTPPPHVTKLAPATITVKSSDGTVTCEFGIYPDGHWGDQLSYHLKELIDGIQRALEKDKYGTV